MQGRRILPYFVLTIAALMAACAPADDAADDAMLADTAMATDTAAATTTLSLYERLGGEAAIRSVVDTMVALAAADDSLNFARTGTPGAWEPTAENIELLKTRLVQFVASATGGPQQYEGEDMATVHEDMQITNVEFDRLGGHLLAALDAHAVPEAEQQELMTIVESTRAAIVTAGT